MEPQGNCFLAATFRSFPSATINPQPSWDWDSKQGFAAVCKWLIYLTLTSSTVVRNHGRISDAVMKLPTGLQGLGVYLPAEHRAV